MRRRAFSHVARIAASIILSLTCFTLHAVAQEAKAQTRQLQPPTKRAFKHKAKIESKYDRFKDQTQVQLETKRVMGGFLEDIKMGASFFYKGQKAMPEDIILVFRSSTQDWRFLRETDRELIALADGERLPLGTLDRDSQVLSGGRVIEVMATDVPYEAFMTIVNAKKVEMKLGRYQFELKEEHLEALRDLASRMAQ
jgi:hypothetical protein